MFEKRDNKSCIADWLGVDASGWYEVTFPVMREALVLSDPYDQPYDLNRRVWAMKRCRKPGADVGWSFMYGWHNVKLPSVGAAD